MKETGMKRVRIKRNGAFLAEFPVYPTTQGAHHTSTHAHTHVPTHLFCTPTHVSSRSLFCFAYRINPRLVIEEKEEEERNRMSYVSIYG